MSSANRPGRTTTAAQFRQTCYRFRTARATANISAIARPSASRAILHVFLQVYLTSSERVMGKYKNSTFTKYLLYAIGGVVTLLNVMLLVSMF